VCRAIDLPITRPRRKIDVDPAHANAIRAICTVRGMALNACAIAFSTLQASFERR